MRLILDTAAYWLMLVVRNAIPKPQPLASSEFPTIRLRLLNIAAPKSMATVSLLPGRV